MLVILLSWIGILLIVLSVGDTVIYGWNKIKKKEEYSLSDTFWIGMATMSAIVTVISLFLPLNLYVLCIIGFVAFLLMVIQRERFGKLVSAVWLKLKSQPLWVKCAFATSFLFILIYTIATPLLYDLGLYHLQTMMWNEEYSVVPGLGNVHGRLAFNSSFLLLSTLFNYHPAASIRFFTINGLSMLVFTWWIIVLISKQKSFAHAIALAILYILFGLEFFTSLSSTSTDILVNILVVYLIVTWLTDWNRNSEKTILFSVIPLFCITLKLSSGIILVFLLIMLIKQIKYKNYKPMWAIVFLGLLFIVPWCIRFIILSGYLIYPFPAIDIFTFDWKMPIEMLVEEKETAYAWARIPFYTVPTQEVLDMSYLDVWKSWFGFLPHRVFFTYTAGLISPLFILPLVRKFVRSPHYLTAWFIAYSGTLFGFITAPCLRFTIGFVVCSICIPFFVYADYVKSYFKIDANNKVYKGTTFTIVSIFFLFILLSIRHLNFFKENNTPIYTYLVRPLSIDYMKTDAQISYSDHQIDKTIIYSPDNEVRCFDQCLPCTPYVNNKIEMRGNNLQMGFRIK